MTMASMSVCDIHIEQLVRWVRNRVIDTDTAVQDIDQSSNNAVTRVRIPDVLLNRAG